MYNAITYIVLICIYRIAADLERNLKKSVPQLPTIQDERPKSNLTIKNIHNILTPKKGQNSNRFCEGQNYDSFSLPNQDDSKFISYCKVLRNVELVRRRMRDHLKVRGG